MVDGPFRRAGLLNRTLPFAAVGVIAIASLALPPGAKSAGYTALSLALLAAVIAAVSFLPWAQLPTWTTVFVPVAFVGSILTLMLATGSPSSGVGIVIVVPLIWTVLFHRRWESLVVVTAIVAAQIVTALTPLQMTNAVICRRIVFWVAVGTLISVATHNLRQRLRHTVGKQETMLRRTSDLAGAAEELTGLFTSHEVLQAATRLAAELVSPPGIPGRRAQYTRVIDSRVMLIAEYDEAGQSLIEGLPLSEHPNLQEVMQFGLAINRPLIAGTAGAQVEKMTVAMGMTNAVYVPVYADGEIDGVLTVPVRGHALSEELFAFCKAIGHLTELALGNARVRELLEKQATRDELTGLPNRRAFEQFVAHRPGRLSFCVLSLDLDGLKEVNDTHGHGAGDELLVHLSNVLSKTIRDGDVFARLGGDEFAGILFNANEQDGAEAARRMLAALNSAPFREKVIAVSIGVASDGPNGIGPTVVAQADAAMYVAKRRGGNRFVVASSMDEARPYATALIG
jgi:diguanylate cyclase (GGDEF)-like protein